MLVPVQVLHQRGPRQRREILLDSPVDGSLDSLVQRRGQSNLPLTGWSTSGVQRRTTAQRQASELLGRLVLLQHCSSCLIFGRSKATPRALRVNVHLRLSPGRQRLTPSFLGLLLGRSPGLSAHCFPFWVIFAAFIRARNAGGSGMTRNIHRLEGGCLSSMTSSNGAVLFTHTSGLYATTGPFTLTLKMLPGTGTAVPRTLAVTSRPDVRTSSCKAASCPK
jgi:hypothetical protein